MGWNRSISLCGDHFITNERVALSRTKGVLSVTRFTRMTAILILIVILIPVLLVAWVPAYNEVRLLTVSGTLTEARPVNYVHSERFVPKGGQLKIVLALRANQQIAATIEVARITGYYVRSSRQGENSEVRIFGLYPEKVMNRTQWDFHHEYSKTLYTSLKGVPNEMLGKVPLGLEIEIFLEAPNFSFNPTFLVYWEITVYDVY
jgi:hypothetical protein